jgi:tubulin monoglycylase TTLL3/8
MKPLNSSRGRGIYLSKNLRDIVNLNRGKEKYVVQKYIENPLIVMNRKFDLRQWVLVTDWNPLVVWMYAEPYLRFPASDFSFNNLNNKYAHLSNNSVCKNAKRVTIEHEIEGNMWSLDDFQEHLESEFGYDVWTETIKKKVKKLVVDTMSSVQDMFVEKKCNMFELFGFDIMLDE